MKHSQKSQSAFTLVEIMIVVAIIGLLAALAVPGFIRSRARSQGTRIVNDARVMDHAITQWATEKGIMLGAAVDTTAASAYLNGSWVTNDVLGNAYSFTVVGTTQVAVNAASKTSLSPYFTDWQNY